MAVAKCAQPKLIQGIRFPSKILITNAIVCGLLAQTRWQSWFSVRSVLRQPGLQYVCLAHAKIVATANIWFAVVTASAKSVRNLVLGRRMKNLANSYYGLWCCLDARTRSDTTAHHSQLFRFALNSLLSVR